jgi:hypothetical protein
MQDRVATLRSAARTTPVGFLSSARWAKYPAGLRLIFLQNMSRNSSNITRTNWEQIQAHPTRQIAGPIYLKMRE